jgi:hypothetical protein
MRYGYRRQVVLQIGLSVMSLAGAVIAQEKSAAPGEVAPAKTATERFDLEVREDIFAGFEGDEDALKRGEEKCEQALKDNPKNSEAKVWLGAVRVFKAGQLFQQNKPLEAMPLWNKGQKDMDDAVAMDPDNVGVRIPRASVLLPSARNTPAMVREPILKKVREDFEYIYNKQAKHLDELGEHSRGELRMGLADTYRLLGQLDKSNEQLEAVAKELPDTEYASVAKKWLAAEPKTKLAHNCLGCHSK